MGAFENVVNQLNFYVWSFGVPVGAETVPIVVIMLLGTGVYLTLRLGFVQFRHFGHGIAVASGRYDDPNETGDVSHFQALSTALSATVGIGNIAGVAIAIHWGGPGALFWMWATALLGMATKFCEVTLAQHYRLVHRDGSENEGTVSGGPMYYIERGLGQSWKPLALFFALMLGLTAFLTGNGIQANTVADNLESAFGIAPWISGVVTASIVAAVILGGIGRIGRVTGILAPLMAGIYVTAALLILSMNTGEIIPAFALIFKEAFHPSAGIAGTGIGALLVTMMWGVKRGLFSNEAGQGSAPIAHAAAKTEEPVSEGVVALLEPFIDTIVIVTMTAMVIIITGVWDARFPTEITLSGGDLSYVAIDADGNHLPAEVPSEIVIRGGQVVGQAPLDARLAWHEVAVETFYVDAEQNTPFTGTIYPQTGTAEHQDGTQYQSLFGPAAESGAPLTMQAFRLGLAPLGDWGHLVVVLCVFLFGVSTAIAWSYYGDRCAHYLLGSSAIVPYKLAFVAVHFIGAVLPLAVVWSLGDVFLGIVILPNLIALVLLTPKVIELMDSYFERKPWLRARGRG